MSNNVNPTCFEKYCYNVTIINNFQKLSTAQTQCSSINYHLLELYEPTIKQDISSLIRQSIINSVNRIVLNMFTNNDKNLWYWNTTKTEVTLVTNITIGCGFYDPNLGNIFIDWCASSISLVCTKLITTNSSEATTNSFHDNDMIMKIGIGVGAAALIIILILAILFGIYRSIKRRYAENSSIQNASKNENKLDNTYSSRPHTPRTYSSANNHMFPFSNNPTTINLTYEQPENHGVYNSTDIYNEGPDEIYQEIEETDINCTKYKNCVIYDNNFNTHDDIQSFKNKKNENLDFDKF